VSFLEEVAGFVAFVAHIHHKRKHYLCNTKILRAKKPRHANNIECYLFGQILLFLSTKKWGNYCFPRVNLTKIFFFGGRICQIVHIQKNKNKNSEEHRL
jgi:hypothetical protein